MLKHNHISGEGNAYYTLFREYDPTLGRWWSADPMRAKYAVMKRIEKVNIGNIDINN